MRHKTILAGAIPMLMSIIGCTVTPNEAGTVTSSIHGWIDSPLLGERRTLSAQAAPGVSWFLGRLEAYSDTGATPVGEPVAEMTYEDAIRLRIYGETIELSESALSSMAKRLEERPHLYRVDRNNKSITYYNQVLIEKTRPSPILEKIKPGESSTIKLGNMPCDLILDALTVPFALEEGQTSPTGVDPRVLLPHLGEQYGAGILSRAVAWRVAERALGWPSGEEGENAALEVAKALRQLCLTSEMHLRHGWCLRDLEKLAENSGADQIKEILASVKAKTADAIGPGM